MVYITKFGCMEHFTERFSEIVPSLRPMGRSCNIFPEQFVMGIVAIFSQNSLWYLLGHQLAELTALPGLEFITACESRVDRPCIVHIVYRQLQDDERLDALLKDLAKRAPDVFASVSEDTYSTTSGTATTSLTTKSPTSEVAADLQKIKGAIAGMQQKLQQTRKPKRR